MLRACALLRLRALLSPRGGVRGQLCLHEVFLSGEKLRRQRSIARRGNNAPHRGVVRCAAALLCAPHCGPLRRRSGRALVVRAPRVYSSGTNVRRGQTLASISSTLGGGEDVATLELAINEASIARDAAAREVARMNSLVEAEAVPARRLDEARTDLRLAEAQLAAESS